jgi:CubicO group peptidase (beta-lactamase class C family)
MAGFAERAEVETTPGTAWNYHDGNYLILSRLIRDAAGGHAADVMQFARRELFDPLGMQGVTLEFDATGTAEGSSQMLAPARDWARFGLLYLNDGMVGGRRILPEGWVRYSASLTPSAWVGMGAGFWTNLGDSKGSRFRKALGMPPDAFYASGVLGQYVVIVPSQHLVIARFGISANQYDIEGVSHLVADVIAACDN